MLRTESTGLVSGNLPFVLTRVENTASPQEKRFIERSRFGAMMVHRIMPEQMSATEIEMLRIMLDFGYGREGCDVHCYREDDYPLRVSVPEVKTLLLKRGGELMILACWWSPQPSTVRIDLSAAIAAGEHLRVMDCEDERSALALSASELTMFMPAYGVRLLRVTPARSEK